MIRCLAASLLVGLLACVFWLNSEQPVTAAAPDETVVHYTSLDTSQPVNDTATPWAATTQESGNDQASALGWLSRSGFLLAALVVMTIILIATHHKQQPEQPQAGPAASEG